MNSGRLLSIPPPAAAAGIAERLRCVEPTEQRFATVHRSGRLVTSGSVGGARHRPFRRVPRGAARRPPGRARGRARPRIVRPAAPDTFRTTNRPSAFGPAQQTRRGARCGKANVGCPRAESKCRPVVRILPPSGREKCPSRHAQNRARPNGTDPFPVRRPPDKSGSFGYNFARSALNDWPAADHWRLPRGPARIRTYDQQCA